MIDLAGGAAVGDDEKAAIAEIDAAIVDDVLAAGHGRHVHRDDVGPELPSRFALFGLPDNRGVAPIVDQRHAMVRIAPEETLAVLQVVEVISCRGRGGGGCGHAGRLADIERGALRGGSQLFEARSLSRLRGRVGAGADCKRDLLSRHQRIGPVVILNGVIPLCNDLLFNDLVFEG